MKYSKKELKSLIAALKIRADLVDNAYKGTGDADLAPLEWREARLEATLIYGLAQNWPPEYEWAFNSPK